MQLSFGYLGLLRDWLSLENQSILSVCRYDITKTDFNKEHTFGALYVFLTKEMLLVRQNKS